MWRPRLSAKTHIAMGQTFLVLTLLMVAMLLGLFPDRDAATREGRTALAEAIAVNGSALMAEGDVQKLEATLRPIVERNDELLSAAARRAGGRVLVSIGDHEANWFQSGEAGSTDSQLIVPIWSAKQRWGQVELRFTRLKAPGWRGMLLDPQIKLAGFLVLACFLVFYLYLRVMLRHLDPSKAVPPHVRSALDSLAEGLMVIDLNQRIVLGNQAFATILGSSSDALLGTSASDLEWIDAEGAPFAKAELPWRRAIKDGMPQTHDIIQLRDHEAQLRTFIANCSPVLGSGGSFGGVLVSLDDVTQLEAHKAELAAAMEAAESANQAKSDFLANMSHEIRTPMNSILGYTEVLKRGYGKGGDYKKYLETISSSGEHLLQLINDVLDLSKVEAGHLEIERIAFAPHLLIQEAMNILAVPAEEKGVSLDFVVDGHIPEQIVSDPTRLRQIVTNLLSNAVKFTEQGGVRVTALLIAGTEPKLSIAVRDSGIGMDPGSVETIFDPFVQADSSVTRRFGGTGLGLPISRRFARLLGGDIEVETSPQGSTFTVTLDTGPLDGVKLLESREALAAKRDTSAVGSGHWEFPAARVLVVDDGPENRELVELVLGEVGLEVEGAENGQIAVDRVLVEDFDVVLMDMQMPVMDGYTATSTLRAQGVELPIIALTANAMSGFEARCLEAGCTGFLTKPVDIDALIETLAGLLGGKRHAGPRPAPPQAHETDVEDRVESRPRAADEAMGSSAEASTADTGPLVSRLAGKGAKFQAIIEKFVPRLYEKLEEIDASWEARDFEEMARLAHWLKGSAGTVGFDDFQKPAANLELIAKEEKAESVEDCIREIRELADRIKI